MDDVVNEKFLQREFRMVWMMEIVYSVYSIQRVK